MNSKEASYAHLVSESRKFRDEARESSWRGYSIVRQQVFMCSSEKSPFVPTQRNMRVDEPFERGDFQAEDDYMRDKLRIGAYLECSGNAAERKGEIMVTIIRPQREIIEMQISMQNHNVED
jgi:hypothetical protein